MRMPLLEETTIDLLVRTTIQVNKLDTLRVKTLIFQIKYLPMRVVSRLLKVIFIALAMMSIAYVVRTIRTTPIKMT